MLKISRPTQPCKVLTHKHKIARGPKNYPNAANPIVPSFETTF